MNILIDALGMLCGLGAATLATTAVGNRNAIGGLGLGFVVSVWALGPDRILDPALVGFVVAAIAIAYLSRPGLEVLTSVCAGALAGLWFAVLQIQNVPVAGALALAVAVPAVSVYMSSRQSDFAPLALGEEALLSVIALALIVAIGPDVISGWESAGVMNMDYETGMESEMSGWVLVLTGGSVVFGSVYSLVWRRR